MFKHEIVALQNTLDTLVVKHVESEGTTGIALADAIDKIASAIDDLQGYE